MINAGAFYYYRGIFSNYSEAQKYEKKTFNVPLLYIIGNHLIATIQQQSFQRKQGP